jgi:GxxExxY protein
LNAAIEVHKYFGPGLMESVYEVLFIPGDSRNGLYVERQKYCLLLIRDQYLEKAFIIDQLINDEIVLK